MIVRWLVLGTLLCFSIFVSCGGTDKPTNGGEDISGFIINGAKIGALYATCCTPIKEPLYQEIFKQLGTTHRNLWQIMGINH